jgi:hypothetical protein
MRKLIGALAAALLCLGLGAPAGAGPLGVTVNPAVGFAQSGAVEIADDGFGLVIVNGAGAPLTSLGISGLASDAFDLFVIGDSLSAPAAVVSLFVDGEGSLAGDLVAFALTPSIVKLLFAVTQDDFGLFGSRVLMVVTGDFASGLEAFDAAVTINPVVGVAPVPLPASLPLLAATLVGFAAIRRQAQR